MANQCAHDHTQDVYFSGLHVDEMLAGLTEWIEREQPPLTTVAQVVTRVRAGLACQRALGLAERWIEEATAHHERERERADRPYDVEADGGIGG